MGVDASGAAESCTADDDSPDNDSEVPDAITVGVGGTVSANADITLKAGSAPTAEGTVQWNTSTDRILVGNGSTTETFYSGPHTTSASDLTSGTLPDARLSSNVPYSGATSPCSADQILKNVGGTWACAADGGSGGHTLNESSGTVGAALTSFTDRANIAVSTSSGLNLTDDPGKDATIFRIGGCPVGFTEVESQGNTLGCIQTDEEGSASFESANDDCFDTYGGTVPPFEMMCAAAANYALTNEDDDSEWVGGGQTSGNNNLWQGASGDCASGTGASAGSNAYRCWIPR